MKNKMSQVAIQSAFFPPIQQISHIMRYNQVVIEQHDTYAKQTFRNRVQIAGPNGLQNLSIPVIKPHGSKTKMKDILVNNEKDWQDQILKSIRTAYRNSPFYEFYIDDFAKILNTQIPKLFDLNLQLLRAILELLEIDTALIPSSDYQHNYEIDLRNIAHPKPQHKENDNCYNPVSYHQLFSEKYGFIENLSIIDLLFNEGPLSYFYLEKTIVNKKLSP
ncbi:WbqC family protein [Salinivirga cyanobacteriivorans]|nr:WbqC family protein [Salinivirga cyanobacteriivorans]